MNTFNSISSELKSCFSTKPIFKILLPIDMVFLFGGLIILFFSHVIGINFGGLLDNIGYWAFILGLILTYANLHEQFLFIGFWSYGAICLIEFFRILFDAGNVFFWGDIFRIAIFGGLGYLVFKHSITARSSAGING